MNIKFQLQATVVIGFGTKCSRSNLHLESPNFSCSIILAPTVVLKALSQIYLNL